MKKKLVAYFSAGGTTKKEAERIAKIADADLFEIKPSVRYTNADLNWMDKKSRSSVEMNNPVSRPEIAVKVDDMLKYETVFIGFPIWWYTAPRIIQTFLESYDFSGKKIALFATSGGSGIEKSISYLQTAYPQLNIAAGKKFGNAAEDDVKQWVESLK